MIPPAPIISCFLIAFCFVFRANLESSPVTHVLVQLPLLIAAGIFLTGQYRVRHEWNAGGFTTLVLALIFIAYWMLPRSIDAALTSPLMAFAKFISVPLFIGVPLKLSWNIAHPILKGFLKAQTISMLGVAAFIYIHAPVRLCNAYLVNEQQQLGYGFLALAVTTALYWTIPLFAFQSSPSTNNARATVTQ